MNSGILGGGGVMMMMMMMTSEGGRGEGVKAQQQTATRLKLYQLEFC